MTIATLKDTNDKIERLLNELLTARKNRSDALIALCPWAKNTILKKQGSFYRVERVEAHAKSDCCTAWCTRRMVTGKYGNALTPLFDNDKGIEVQP